MADSFARHVEGYHVFLGYTSSFLNSGGNIGAFSDTYTNFVFLISNSNKSFEAHAATTFNGARNTIDIDSDFFKFLWCSFTTDAITTIIAAAVLFFLGTGTIRGFAITLGLGTILSMLTAITLTQYLLKLMINAKVFMSASAYGANSFMLWKKPVYRHRRFIFQTAYRF